METSPETFGDASGRFEGAMARKTGVVRDNRYLRHGAGEFHPENYRRLEVIHAILDTPDMAGKLFPIPPRHATRDEILRLHSEAYFRKIASTAGEPCTPLDPDTEACADSFDTALLAVGGLLNAIDAVLDGSLDNAFAFVRPPGHHAERHASGGFCLFNNIALGAAHALAVRGLKRILIVDWDLHHGNGTQDLFYGDPRVLYFSTHQFPAYPGSGAVDEIGQGEAKGYTINIPLAAGSGNAHYVKVFRQILQPVARMFRPELILVSAGFDTYDGDPLGDMRVTPDGFACLTRLLMNLADELCGGKIVLVLEGGYDLRGLARSVRAVLKELTDDTHVTDDELDRLETDAVMWRSSVLSRVMERLAPFWPVF
ncbi:MAG: histone deacetylase [Syntrophaceae bacterium]|nr:histone deacetylase [Syntrophaceae bacterium]